MKTIDNADSFVPLAPDENAAAYAEDVLIAPGKAKTAAALTVVIQTLPAEMDLKTAGVSNDEYKGEKIVKTEAE